MGSEVFLPEVCTENDSLPGCWELSPLVCGGLQWFVCKVQVPALEITKARSCGKTRVDLTCRQPVLVQWHRIPKQASCLATRGHSHGCTTLHQAFVELSRSDSRREQARVAILPVRTLRLLLNNVS